MFVKKSNKWRNAWKKITRPLKLCWRGWMVPMILRYEAWMLLRFVPWSQDQVQNFLSYFLEHSYQENVFSAYILQHYCRQLFMGKVSIRESLNTGRNELSRLPKKGLFLTLFYFKMLKCHSHQFICWYKYPFSPDHHCACKEIFL